MKLARPGRFEREVVGAMEGIVNALGCRMAFPPIVTINGQTLHMHGSVNELRKGRMLVMDAGAESWLHYASDITRTVPVGGKFSQRQKDIYEIVLEGQETAIRLDQARRHVQGRPSEDGPDHGLRPEGPRPDERERR